LKSFGQACGPKIQSGKGERSLPEKSLEIRGGTARTRGLGEGGWGEYEKER